MHNYAHCVRNLGYGSNDSNFMVIATIYSEKMRASTIIDTIVNPSHNGSE